MRLEMGSGTDSGEHEELGRVERASREDDFV